MARRGFPPVAPPAAVLVVLLVAAAAGGARGLRGNAAQPRKLAAGGSGDSPRRRAAELVKESSHASVMGGRAYSAATADSCGRRECGGRSVLGRICPWGGAWCASPHACEYRARMHLGSTKHARSVAVMLDRQNGSMQGMLSNNRTVNPDFYNWNAVYFIYCDGGSFSGHQDQPVRFNVSHPPLRPSAPPPLRRSVSPHLCLSACSPLDRFTFPSPPLHLSASRRAVSSFSFPPSRIHLPPPSTHSPGIPLYMRGRRVADLLVKHLMEQKGLGHAKKVRGGSVRVGSVRVGSVRVGSVRVVVSGSSAGGVALLLHCDRVRDTLTAASPSMHVRYLADASMFLDIPDSDNTHRIAAFFSEVQTMHVNYRKAVANTVAPLAHSSPANAVFLFSCFQHGSIHSDVPWMMRTAKGVPMYKAVSRWMRPGNTDEIDLIEGAYPCNSCIMAEE
ncbi:unnamed protein product [Closterium sp. NIES-64]|nr:unnamed protein product [Closterium sp. NIES-64]